MFLDMLLYYYLQIYVTWNGGWRTFLCNLFLQENVQEQKRLKACPDILIWELNSNFDTNELSSAISRDTCVNYRGEVIHPLFKFVSTEYVVSDSICDFKNVPSRNAKLFKDGSLHNHLDAWKDTDSFSEIVTSY